MVWFASWRSKFRKVVLCTIIISALADAGGHIHRIKSYNQAREVNAAYSEILELDQVRKKTQEAMKEVYKMLIEAAEMKTLAEKLSREGKTEESRQVYRELLRKYEKIIEILTMPDKQGLHIALAKNNIIRIKNKLQNDKSFDANRTDIAALEEDIYNAWLEVDRLTKSVSADLQEVERMLGMIR